MEVDGDRDEIDLHYQRLLSEATASGYFLNPDGAFARDLVKGLVTNRKRYGYQSCPCRLASGDSAEDRDIVCPCDYRDADLGEYGACYCALYVSRDASVGLEEIGPVPEKDTAGTGGVYRVESRLGSPGGPPCLSCLAVPCVRLSLREGRAARGYVPYARPKRTASRDSCSG